MPSGGARPGAGRPKGSQTRRTSPKEPTGIQYSDVLEYLRAVALGTEPADPLRIAAAKAALPYEAPRKRAPVASKAPAQLRSTAYAAAEEQAQAAWREKADAIRSRRNSA